MDFILNKSCIEYFDYKEGMYVLIAPWASTINDVKLSIVSRELRHNILKTKGIPIRFNNQKDIAKFTSKK